MKSVERITFTLLIIFGIFTAAAPIPVSAANQYSDFIKGAKTLGFEPTSRFVNEIYYNIKHKYPNEVEDSIIFGGAKKELKALLGAYGMDSSQLDAMQPDQRVLINFLKAYKDKVSQNIAVYACAYGMVMSLKDPECELILPSVSKNPRRDMIPEGYGGIAVIIEMRNNRIILVHLFKDGPAQKSGLKPGDIITAIDGQTTQGQDLDTVLHKLRGKVGTKVNLGVNRGGKAFDVAVTREDVKLNPITAGVSKTGVGYIKIAYFSDDYPEAVYEALEKFREKGIKKWVLDLRDNAGGALNNLIIAGSLFVPKDEPIMFIKYREKEQKFTSVAKKNLQPPSAVIVNNYTTGSAEALAEAIRDYNGTKIFGLATSGKSAVAELFPLSGGATLKLTVGEMITGKRRILHKKGIAPDVKIEGSNNPANDLSILGKVANSI